MGKYDPLNRYLARRRDAALEFSFTELERLLGALLPNGAQTEAWWSNDADSTSSMVQPRAWLDAGYEATLLPGERVRFRRRSPPGQGERQP